MPKSFGGLVEPAEGRLIPSVAPMVEHFAENYDLFRALKGSSGIDLALSTVRRSCEEDWQIRLGRTGQSGVLARATSVFLAAGLIEMVLWWLHAGMPISAREVAAHYDGLIDRALSDLPGATSAQ